MSNLNSMEPKTATHNELKLVVKQLQLACNVPDELRREIMAEWKNNRVHRIINKVYNVGDMRPNMGKLEEKSSFEKIIVPRLLKRDEKFEEIVKEIYEANQNPITKRNFLQINSGTKDLDDNESVSWAGCEDMNSYNDSMNMNVSCNALNLLFNRTTFASFEEKIEKNGRKIIKKNTLWPATQPHVNNRKVAVKEYIHDDNPSNDSKQTIEKLLLADAGFLTSQTVYCIPYKVKRTTKKARKNVS